MNPAQEARLAMRRGEWTGPTKHQLPGYVKCNLVVLPLADACDFLVFCQRNPKPFVGEPLTAIPEGVMPAFWACGVTPQWVALQSRPELLIAHAFVTDLQADQICIP